MTDMKEFIMFLFLMPTGVHNPDTNLQVEKIRRAGPFKTMSECRNTITSRGFKESQFYLFADRGMRYGFYKCKEVLNASN